MNRRLLALAGGVGGARLAHGLLSVCAPDQLSIVVNTGDDFEHLGLSICPDLDTIFYTLSGLADRARGWGRAEESWHFMDTLRSLGGEDWFNLGDRDLALHVLRSVHLRAGGTLEQFTARLGERMGIDCVIAPMSNDPVSTRIHTDRGELAFQDYFVRLRCEPPVRAIDYAGAARAQPSDRLIAALADPTLGAVVLCPSNPWLSIAPIVALPAVAAWFDAPQRRVPVVAVSPIVGGAALKGPAAKIMVELGFAASVLGLSDYYGARVDGWVIDELDRQHAAALHDRGKSVMVSQTVMRTDEDRADLARTVIDFAERVQVRS